MNAESPKQQFYKELDAANITEIGIVKFVTGNDWFVANSPLLKKLGITLVDRFGKIQFAPNELLSVYHFLEQHILGDLGYEDRFLIETKLYAFVVNGGEIQVIERSNLSNAVDTSPLFIKVAKKMMYIFFTLVICLFAWHAIFLSLQVTWITETLYIDYQKGRLLQLLDRVRTPWEEHFGIINPLLGKKQAPHIILSDIDGKNLVFLSWGDTNPPGVWFYKDPKAVYYVFQESFTDFYGKSGNHGLSAEKIGANPEKVEVTGFKTVFDGRDVYKCDFEPARKWEVCYKAP